MAQREGYLERVERYKQDHAAYCREILKIVDKNGDLVPLELNRAQRRVNTLIDEIRAKGKPVRLYILKARQLGMSTYIQSLEYKRATLYPNTNAVVVAHDIDAATGLHEKSKTFAQMSPDDFRPMQKLNNRRELHFDNPDPEGAPGLKSRIVIQTADNDNLGVSQTLSFVHLSEFAAYEAINKRIKQVMAKLRPAVPHRQNTYVIIETTARGTGYAKDVWDDPKSGYTKVFISWAAGDEYRSDERVDFATLSDTPAGHYGDELGTYRVLVKELEFWYPELNAAERHLEAMHKLAWRRHTIDTGFEGDLALFRQEFPLTPEEAFMSSGTNVFDTARLHGYKQALEETSPEGLLIGLKHPPRVYRFDKEARDYFPALTGGLRLYELPMKGRRYVIGADTAEGLSQGDDAGAQVLRIPEMVQVATLQDQIPPDDLADALYALGKLYNWAWLAVEINGPGIATVLRLSRALHYPALYSREVFDDTSGKFQQKFGWQTNVKTKPLMLTDLRGAIRDDLILFRDVTGKKGRFDGSTIDQLMHYVQSKEGKMGATAGRNDDLVMSLALALQMALQMGYARLGRVPEERPAPEQSTAPPFGSFEYLARIAERADLENRDAA